MVQLAIRTLLPVPRTREDPQPQGIRQLYAIRTQLNKATGNTTTLTLQPMTYKITKPKKKSKKIPMYTPPHHIIPHHTSIPTSRIIQTMPSPYLNQSPSLQPIPTHITKQMTIKHTFKPLAPHLPPPTHRQVTERYQTSTPSQTARAQVQTNPIPLPTPTLKITKDKSVRFSLPSTQNNPHIFTSLLNQPCPHSPRTPSCTCSGPFSGVTTHSQYCPFYKQPTS
jgi:hypothetical protein